MALALLGHLSHEEDRSVHIFIGNVCKLRSCRAGQCIRAINISGMQLDLRVCASAVPLNLKTLLFPAWKGSAIVLDAGPRGPSIPSGSNAADPSSKPTAYSLSLWLMLAPNQHQCRFWPRSFLGTLSTDRSIFFAVACESRIRRSHSRHSLQVDFRK